MWILLLILTVVVMSLLAREFGTIWLPYAAACSMVARGRKDTARRVFERVIGAPTLLSKGVRREARFRLSWLLMEQGQYAEAAELLQTNLATRLAPATEANTRQRLAEALEGAGSKDAADAERARATQLLTGAAQDANTLLSEANMLNKQQRFAEAYEKLERGLAQIPAANTPARAKTMVQLGLAAFNAGKPEDAIRWGEQALQYKPELTIHMTAHSVAGLGYATIGNLEQAEAHRAKALEIATQAGNRDKAAQYMVQVAEIKRRRGQLAEAMQMCEQAAAMTVSERRIVYAAQSEILANWGRFEEASTALEQSLRAQKFATPSSQKRVQSAFSCGLACLEAERGLPEQALAHIEEGLAGLQEDAKLTTRYQAGRLWILALLGRREEVLAQTPALEAQALALTQDRSTQLQVTSLLGRAFLTLGDYPRSLSYWEQFLACLPDPVSLPKAYYFVGECYLKMGDIPAAWQAWQSAVSQGIDTVYTRWAQRQLALLTNAPQVPAG